MKSKYKPFGFTLIELLVVIALVGLLSSVVLLTRNNAGMNARDTKLRSDIAQIQKALEMYYDANGRYATSRGAICAAASWTSSNTPVSWSTFESALGALFDQCSKRSCWRSY